MDGETWEQQSGTNQLPSQPTAGSGLPERLGLDDGAGHQPGPKSLPPPQASVSELRPSSPPRGPSPHHTSRSPLSGLVSLRE